MFSKNGRVSTVVVMVMLFVWQLAGQLVVAAPHAMETHHRESSVLANTNETKQSCHEETQSADEIDSAASVVVNTFEPQHENYNDEQCCKIDCQCPVGQCTTAALLLNSSSGDGSFRFTSTIAFTPWLVASQTPSSLYRPPIYIL